MTTAPEPPASSTGPAAEEEPPPGRRPGYLHRKVALFLADHPEDTFKVGDLTTAIDAPSKGAVFEVLKRLAAAGHATHTRDPHHRFRITQAGIDAAGTLPAAPAGPPTGGGGSGRSARRGPILRPNGERYFPRSLAGAADVDVLRRLRAKHIAVLLYGPPGTGKTAVIEAAFPDLLTVTGTGDTVVEDLLGTFIPLPEGGYEFAYGPAVQAMRQGRPLLIDDATLIPPRVLAVLYPAMDGRRVLHIPSYRNERVEAVDGFYVIAAHNPGVHGAVLSDALASRFDVHIEVSTDWALVKRLGVPAPAIDAGIALNDALDAGRVTWAPQLREMLGFARVRKALGDAAAIANLAGRAPDDDRPAVIDALSTAFGTTVTPLALGPQR
ncbi:AAA family ATPase [Dactylosporangium sp. NPDC000244]|uniref:AAA family ATPase n=1 Tax=Dactylosporangium sp. NPDC000244 TaxID=3154365 RepID=UPI003319D1F3